MKGNWLPLVLILATAIQQIVAGVSCCCFATALFRPEPSLAVAQAPTSQIPPSEILPSPTPRCSKCKPKVTRPHGSPTRTDRPTEAYSGKVPIAKAHSDPCDCANSIQHLAIENHSLKHDGSRHSKTCGTDESDLSNPTDHRDLCARISLLSALLQGGSEPTPAPEPIGARLSRLSFWII